MDGARSVLLGGNRLEVGGSADSGSETGELSAVGKLRKAGGGGGCPAVENGAMGEDDGADGVSPRNSSGDAAVRAGGSTALKGSAVSANGAVNSLLARRRRLKRNLSAAAATSSTPGPDASLGCKMPSASFASASALGTRSLDRKAVLRHRPAAQLQPSDRDWVRADLSRGCVRLRDCLLPSQLRPVLCTRETTAAAVARALSRHGGRGGAVRVLGAEGPATERRCGDDDPPRLLPSEALTPQGGPAVTAQDGLSEDRVLSRRSTGVRLTPAPSTPMNREERGGLLDPLGSSSDELDFDCSSSASVHPPSSSESNDKANGRTAGARNWVVTGARGAGSPDPGFPQDSAPTLYVQLHGEAVRRLEPDEKPLSIQNEYLSGLGFGDPRRVQDEGLDAEIGCLIRFYAGTCRAVKGCKQASTLSPPAKCTCQMWHDKATKQTASSYAAWTCASSGFLLLSPKRKGLAVLEALKSIVELVNSFNLVSVQELNPWHPVLRCPALSGCQACTNTWAESRKPVHSFSSKCCFGFSTDTGDWLKHLHSRAFVTFRSVAFFFFLNFKFNICKCFLW